MTSLAEDKDGHAVVEMVELRGKHLVTLGLRLNELDIVEFTGVALWGNDNGFSTDRLQRLPIVVLSAACRRRPV
jgi:hypothetical protein